MSAVYVLAWLLPLAAGIAACLAVSPRRGPGWCATAVGYGFFFGALLAASCTALAARSDTQHAWWSAGGCLLAVLAFAAAIAWKRSTPGQIAAAADRGTFGRLAWVLLSVLLVSLALRGALAAREIWLRPTYPWDAWAVWAAKAKTWFLLGHHVSYVSSQVWLQQPPPAEWFSCPGWFYPEALPWMQVWFASAAGGWIEPLVNLPWLGLWLAILCASYGQWIALGLSRARALVGVYVLGSLPLLTVHAAIAGYADSWIAAVFAFAVLSWMRWLQHGEKDQLWLALVCALALPWLKMEGWVWMCCLLGVIGLGVLPARWRWPVVLCGGVLFLILFPLGGMSWLVRHAGLVRTDGGVGVPAIGPLAFVFDLHWRPGALTGAIETLFAHPNWHLLWWLTPVVVAWRWRMLMAHDWLRLPAALLGLCIALLLFLFLFTDAGQWAQSFTAINRLMLQLTPALVTILVMLLRDARLPEAARDTAPASAPRSGPG